MVIDTRVEDPLHNRHKPDPDRRFKVEDVKRHKASKFLNILHRYGLTIDDLEGAVWFGGRFQRGDNEADQEHECHMDMLMQEITQQKYREYNMELASFPQHREQCLCGKGKLYYNCYWLIPKTNQVIGIDIPYPVGSCCNELLYGLSPSQEKVTIPCMKCKTNTCRRSVKIIGPNMFNYTCRKCKKQAKRIAEVQNNGQCLPCALKARLASFTQSSGSSSDEETPVNVRSSWTDMASQQNEIECLILPNGNVIDLPILEKWRVGFGKWKGEMFKDVPADYIKWFYEQSNLENPENVKYPFQSYVKYVREKSEK